MSPGTVRTTGTKLRSRKVRPDEPRPNLELASSLDAPNGWTDSVVATSHASIAVRQSSGNKLPVVLIHGNSSCKAVFDRQIESGLGQEYRLLAIDLPGHGDSSDAFDPARSYSVPGFADVVLELLENLGIDQAVVVGWAMGGHIGLELISTFPGLIGLMITGTPPVGRSLAAVRMGFRPDAYNPLTGRQDLTEEEGRNFTETTLGAARTPMLEAAIARADPRVRQLVFTSFLDGALSDQRQIVETSEIPLAVVNGADDSLVDVDYLGTLSYANLWTRKCYLVPRAGHAPFLDTPVVFNHLLRQFLRRMEGRARGQSNNPALCLSG